MGDERLAKSIAERAGDLALEIANRNAGIPLDLSNSPNLDYLKDKSRIQYEIVFTADEMAQLKKHSRNPGIYIDASRFPTLNSAVELAFISTQETPMKLTKAEASHLAEALTQSNTSKPGSRDDELLKAIITKLQNAGSFKVAE